MTTREIDVIMTCLRNTIEEYGYNGALYLLKKLHLDIFLEAENTNKAKKSFAYACIFCGLILLDLDNEKIYNILKDIGVDIKNQKEKRNDLS